MTLLCVSLVEPDTGSLLEAMHSLPPEVDVAEVRLDRMASFDLERILRGRDRPTIVTYRPARQGGGYEGPEAGRLEVLRRAAELGADYVDVELDANAALGPLPGGTRRIVSHHEFQGMPADLEGLFRRLADSGADVVKLAVRPHDAADSAAVLDLLKRHADRVPLVAIGMGEEGVATRVLAPKYGAFLTYAARAGGKEAGPGQVSVQVMLDLYRFRCIGPGTQVYGVVANPVAHSMSPAVHNAAFAEAGLDAVYLPFKVVDPAAFLDGFQRHDLRGLSVTIPHKEAMLGLMDEVEPLAGKVGAVNTVLIRQGRRYGCNTDVAAAVGTVERAARLAGMESLSGRDVLIVGAGGAARAVAYGLAEKGARLTIANRTVERAERLARELGARWCGLDSLQGLRPDVLVNATSVGMWPNVDACPVPSSLLRSGMVVFDSVYNPPRTRLIEQAEAAGAVVASGLEWFVEQAAAQFELWTGRDAPRQVIRRALLEGLGAE